MIAPGVKKIIENNMKILKTLRQIVALPIAGIGIVCLALAAWLSLDNEDWAESYATRKTPIPRKE